MTIIAKAFQLKNHHQRAIYLETFQRFNSLLLYSGIVVFVGLFGTFFHVNSTIRKQIALKVYFYMMLTCLA